MAFPKGLEKSATEDPESLQPGCRVPDADLKTLPRITARLFKI
jgi:hypothetical protein